MKSPEQRLVPERKGLETIEQVKELISTALEEAENEEDAKRLIGERLREKKSTYLGPIVYFHDHDIDYPGGAKAIESLRYARVMLQFLGGKSDVEVEDFAHVVKDK